MNPKKRYGGTQRKDSLFVLFAKHARQMTFKLLFKVRYFIANLYSQLKKLYQAQKSNYEGLDTVRLWRGKPSTRVDLAFMEHNQSNLFITNSFTATTFDRLVAKAYAGVGTQLRDNNVSVIYRMQIVTMLTLSNPIADLTEHSSKKDEMEALLPMQFFFNVASVGSIEVIL